MKKHLKLTALLSAAALLLCACSAPENVDSDDSSVSTSTTQNDSSTTSSTSLTTSSTANSEPTAGYDPSGLPRMDGSTSAIPLEIGLKSGFFGIPYNEAKELVSHTTTHDSFKRLINGEVDLIFSVPISEEQQKLADDAGAKLIMEPVAREGFVFAVNADNPVDSLTSEQLRKIYSGEITNWSQVGGNDEPILPYQRNKDSGSQNYMTVFMGDTPLIDPKIDYVKGGMGGLMDAIAIYDNSSGAIGYSVYSYAAQMYANSNKVKFLAVDGVAPSKATMADESYPLLSCTYIIYTDKSPESAKEFAAKALSDEGQNYILECGYLPVNGMDVPEKYLPYEAVGTGEPRPADADFSRYSTISTYYFDSDDPIVEKNNEYKVVFLKDKELQDRINSDIEDARKRLGRYGRVDAQAQCRNGYLSIALYKSVAYFGLTYACAETLTYDLFTGKKLERLSDLFFEGEDFVPVLNKRIGNKLRLQSESLYFYDPEELNIPKLDFSGLLGEQRLFTINSVGLEPDNLYFVYGQFTDYTNIHDFQMSDLSCVAARYRDMKEIVSGEWIDKVMEFDYGNEWITEYVEEDDGIFLRIVDSPFHTAEEVKAEDEFRHELQRRRLELLRKWIPDYGSGSIRYGKEDNYYYVGNQADDWDWYFRANFDADTLEIITLDMLIVDDWRQYLREKDEAFAGYKLYPSYWQNRKNDENVDILAYPDKPTEWGRRPAHLSVPKDKINKRYLTAE